MADQPDNRPANPGDGPPPANVLDSVFREDGPLPPARIWLRILAFFLDFILLAIVSTVVIWQLIIPQSHPGAWAELRSWVEQLLEWMGSGNTGAPGPEPSHNLARAMQQANELQLLFFWVYFAAGEAFFGGSSLGKRICRIRSVSTVTLGPMPKLTGIVRGGLKTVCLFFFPIFTVPATLLALCFNRRRQMGHDLLSRTAVIDERSVQIKNS